MATKRDALGAVEVDGPSPTKVPPPVLGGTEYLERLGTFIDNVMGDRRVRRRTEEALAPMTLRDEEIDDPPPMEPPPAVDEGSEEIREGERPDTK